MRSLQTFVRLRILAVRFGVFLDQPLGNHGCYFHNFNSNRAMLK